MRLDVVTIFPELFGPFAETSILGDACRRGLVSLHAHDLRTYTTDRHHTVDDTPYGGGPGMVMKPEPLVTAIEALAGEKGEGRSARVLLMSPQGARFEQRKAEALAHEAHLVLVCGRYEGVDQRAIDLAVDEEISIGDYVLAGGESAALVVVEAVTRLVPGVVGNPESPLSESFQPTESHRGGLLEGPQYTRPAQFRDLEVPEVLRSGHHAEIERWRYAQALARTERRRPDLLRGHGEAKP